MNKDKLRAEVAYELDQLEQVADLATRLAALPAVDRRPWDAAAAAKYVYDLVLGLESLCRRRNAALGVAQPSGPDVHRQLLQQFLDDPLLGGRLSEEFVVRLQKYNRFRHRFAHGYGHQVSWEIVEEPLRLLPDTIHHLGEVWSEWVRQL
jgi:hypothetical protein